MFRPLSPLFNEHLGLFAHISTLKFHEIIWSSRV